MSPPVLISLSMVMWMATEIAAGIGLNGTPLPQIVWLRYFAHLALMLVVLGWPMRLSFVRTGRPGLQLTRSLLMLVMPMCYVLAVQTARSSAVFAVFATAPLLVLALSKAAGDRIPLVAWVTSVVAIVGALVLYRPQLLSMGWGALAAAGMSVSFSGYIVLTRVLDRTEALLTNLFYSALGVFLALSFAVPFFWAPIGTRELFAAAAVATSGWIGLLLLELGLRRDTPARVAPFLFTQTLLDGGLRAVDRGNVPLPAIVLGTGLIAGAMAYAFAWMQREDRGATFSVTRQRVAAREGAATVQVP